MESKKETAESILFRNTWQVGEHILKTHKPLFDDSGRSLSWSYLDGIFVSESNGKLKETRLHEWIGKQLYVKSPKFKDIKIDIGPEEEYEPECDAETIQRLLCLPDNLSLQDVSKIALRFLARTLEVKRDGRLMVMYLNDTTANIDV